LRVFGCLRPATGDHIAATLRRMPCNRRARRRI
jgi:hypothetical protein